MSSSDASTDAIVFVEDYNIFYIPDVAVEEKKIFPLSQAEVVIPEVIFHGIPDWIYEGTVHLDNLWGQPIKLTSELLGNQQNALLFFEIVPNHFCGASEVQT